MEQSEMIKEIRARTGLSQAQFAARFDIPQRTLEDWERGARCCPPYVITLLDKAVKTE